MFGFLLMEKRIVLKKQKLCAISGKQQKCELCAFRVRQLMSKQSSAQPVKNDAISNVFGPERRWRVRGLGFGALPSKVDYPAYSGSKYGELEEEMHELKFTMQRILAKLEGVEVNNESNIVPPVLLFGMPIQEITMHLYKALTLSNNIVKKRKKWVNTTEGVVDQEAGLVPSTRTMHLLSWLDDDKKVVAAADLHSKDPKEAIHCVPLGPDMWKVWVREVNENMPLIRPNSEFTTLSEALGSTIAWPVSLIKET